MSIYPQTHIQYTPRTPFFPHTPSRSSPSSFRPSLFPHPVAPLLTSYLLLLRVRLESPYLLQAARPIQHHVARPILKRTRLGRHAHHLPLRHTLDDIKRALLVRLRQLGLDLAYRRPKPLHRVVQRPVPRTVHLPPRPTRRPLDLAPHCPHPFLHPPLPTTVLLLLLRLFARPEAAGVAQVKIAPARLELTRLTWRARTLLPAPITSGVCGRDESANERGHLLLQTGKHGGDAVVAVAVAAGRRDGEEVGAQLRLVQGDGERSGRVVGVVAWEMRLAGVRLEEGGGRGRK